MKLNKASTQLGVTFKIVEYEDSDIVTLAQDPAKLTRITDCVNADRRQKVALVAARSDLSDLIYGKNPDGTMVEGVTGLGFAREVKTLTKDGETAYVWGETDNDHINRFRDGLVDGSVTVEGYTQPSGDESVKEKAATAFIQNLADKCGDKVFNDASAYVLDITVAARKPGVGPGIPKWALETADLILGKKLEHQSRAKHVAGYVSASGIQIDPIVCDELKTSHPHTTPEEHQAVHEHNRRAVAKWCTEARRQENKKRSKNAVEDFA